jgi:undecaprenyl-diphosphatase
MTEIIDALILGIVQGLTEFLPVSSSGHLELFKFLLGEDALPSESLLMTVVLHFGTALSTVYVFRNEILQIVKGLFAGQDGEADRVFSYKIILSMIPATFVGLFFEKEIESMFTQNIILVCSMLIITGILLFIADKADYSDKGVSYKNAFIIGISQAIAITPGISRSGATISTSVLLGIDRAEAAKFSFLMVVPLIFGKMAKDLLDGGLLQSKVPYEALFTGFIASFLVGVLACTWMISLIRKSQLKYFGWYCFVVGFTGVIYGYYTS